jgi:predicted amidophosphoribosyltransferase
MSSAERYPTPDIKASLLNEWEDDDYAILRYLPKSRGGVSDVGSGLVLDFKRGDAEAANLMQALVLEALRRQEASLRDEHNCRYIIALPSHEAGRSSSPCARLAAEVATKIDWLTLLPPLVRRTSVGKSAWAPPGKRPDQEAHRLSMSYVGPPLAKGDESIIMLDDVITAGTTSAAAREILLEATRCPRVLGLFLSRTTYG